MENELQLETPYDSFIFAIRSPITREKYLGRLAYFMSFVGINEGNLEGRCNIFGQKCKADTTWLVNNVIRYLHTHRERVERREISASTLINYIKPIKLFCEQLEISLPWKRITRGIPRGRRYANDRIPTIEEIRKIVEYPDRRIKSIVYTMASSGIRLGAKEIFSPRMAVIWCFVPILNLWKPYQLVQQIWKASNPQTVLSNGTEWKNSASSNVVKLWWIIWISFAFTRLIDVLIPGALFGFEPFYMPILISIITTSVVSTYFFIHLIRRISVWQEIKAGNSI